MTSSTILFEADISSYSSALPSPSVHSQAANGFCTVSGDKSRLIYEKIDQSFHGIDECTIYFSSCSSIYQIDFTDEEPHLVPLDDSMLCD